MHLFTKMIFVNIVTIGGFKGAQGCAPRRSNSFDFMQFSGKFGKIVCWRPPPQKVPNIGEILDPPLLTTIVFQ